MSFSIDQFYRVNRRILIWIVLFVLLWLLRDFFGVIFLTFVLSFIAAPLIRHSQRWLRLGRRTSIVAVYLLFLAALCSFLTYVTPALIHETRSMIGEFRGIENRLLEIKAHSLRDMPTLNNTLIGYLRDNLPETSRQDVKLTSLEGELRHLEDQLQDGDGNAAINADASANPAAPSAAGPRAQDEAATTTSAATEPGPPAAIEKNVDQDQAANRAALILKRNELRTRYGDEVAKLYLNAKAVKLAENAPSLVQNTMNTLFTIAVALLFSFLISMDIPSLESQLRSLSASRLRDFYEQTAQPVVRFAYVVGRAIQAQAVIAVANTALTLIGLWILNIPSVALLSVIVFVCSFIPVLGVFFSTVPIMLFALNSGGFKIAVAALIMICVIHAVEAYILNPLIYGRHLKINPVIVLIILFIGHHAFGAWGMILGVPVAHYFIHDVFGVPLWGEKKLPPNPVTQQTVSQATLKQLSKDEPGARAKKK